MPRKKKITVFDTQAETAWRDFEIATKSSKPALLGGEEVSKMLGITKAALPAIANAGILCPIDVDGRGVEGKYILKEVVCMRGNILALSQMRTIAADWIHKKNSAKPRKRDIRAGPDVPPA